MSFGLTRKKRFSFLSGLLPRLFGTLEVPVVYILKSIGAALAATLFSAFAISIAVEVAKTNGKRDSLVAEKLALDKQIADLRAQNQALAGSIIAVKKGGQNLEEKLRDEFDMIRSGETIVSIVLPSSATLPTKSAK